MVNKKQTNITVELFTKRRVIYISPTIPQEKNTERGRRKHVEPKKYKVFKKKETARARECRLKKGCQSNYKSATQHQSQKQ